MCVNDVLCHELPNPYSLSLSGLWKSDAEVLKLVRVAEYATVRGCKKCNFIGGETARNAWSL